MESQEEIAAAAARIIREKSAGGQLVQCEEILVEFKGQGLLESDVDDDDSLVQSAIRAAIVENDDLKEISGLNAVPYYYSSQSLSATYAGILLHKEEGDPELITHVVRENSAIYPRPVPLDIFGESPFDLTQEEILECLDKMAENKAYQDIARTTTSIGTVFLYSNRHLEPDYASVLAEWLDVGQMNNP